MVHFDCKNALSKRVTMRVTQKLALDSGEIVREHQLRSFVEFGGERVVISSDEVSHIKKLSNGSKKSSLSILGFKPMNSIPKMHIMDRPYFAYPSDEEGILGSKEAFSALHTAMLDKKVLAIGKLITSVKATCHLVAIIPQCESTFYVGKESSPTLGSDEQEKSYSSGFLIVHIPYEDDIRSLEDNFHASADSRLVKAVKGIICNQQFGEINLGNCFPNPAMSNFWNYIESIALGTRSK
uniref:Ku domain-containing protein n=1 Tax=Proboscia inermis TaxID=420281 RepID=A0A7S0CAL4_9STRA|mmetsp:Transcript_35816/g.36025  ORF Transcript_35816/g.36025 Transcript_35816/m.36025 type:complete len:239 (+) Transcript_35816:565-1281(+)